MKKLGKELENQFLWNVFTKGEMPHEIRLIEHCGTRQFCECVANAMIVYHKPPDFASNFYQQVSFLVADAFLSISGNAFRFDAKCVVGLEIHGHLLVYTHSPQKNCHFYIYLSTSVLNISFIAAWFY